MTNLEVILATFLAASVEWVEAFTIVLAVALTTGWPRAASAAAAAFAVLALMVLAGTALLSFIPSLIWAQFIIGAFLILFGLRWLAKAIARAAGLKPMHDEEAEFTAITQQTANLARRGALLIAFNGVLMEGLEVWLIVVALGVQTHHTLAASAAALAALATVIAAGAVLHRPLANVPENTIKFIVGGMLLSLGSFWVLQALGYAWPLGDGALPPLAAFYLLCGLGLIALMRASRAKIAKTP
jgi:uncharacterized membrane protein